MPLHSVVATVRPTHPASTHIVWGRVRRVIKGTVPQSCGDVWAGTAQALNFCIAERSAPDGDMCLPGRCFSSPLLPRSLAPQRLISAAAHCFQALAWVEKTPRAVLETPLVPQHPRAMFSSAGVCPEWVSGGAARVSLRMLDKAAALSASASQGVITMR